jgi:RNA polymerase sigma factor (TIGR02999 family)
MATSILQSAIGEPGAAAGILAARLHDDLRRIARRHLARESRHKDEVEPASLVNETYLRLVHQRGLNDANDAQFLALASVCMGRVLIDRARRRCAGKRPQESVELTEIDVAAPSRIELTLEVHEVLERLDAQNPRRASILRLRFFDDLSVSEIAHRTALSVATVKRELRAGLSGLKTLLQH